MLDIIISSIFNLHCCKIVYQGKLQLSYNKISPAIKCKKMLINAKLNVTMLNNKIKYRKTA